MKKGSVRNIFDQLILSDESEKLILRFKDESSAEAARVSLYKEKAAFSLRSNNKTTISIRRRYQPDKGIYSLELSQISTAFEIWKVSSTGEISEIFLQDEVEVDHLPVEKKVKEEDYTPETPDEILLQFLKEGRSSTFIDMIFLETFPSVNWRELATHTLGYSQEEINNNE